MRWDCDHVSAAAQRQRIVAGFNIFGYEDAQAVIRAAERVGAPVLLMVNRDARRVMAVESWGALLGSLAERSTVPVGIHLDHCTDETMIDRAIDSGFSSVMYDGSKLPLGENLGTSERLARRAHSCGVLLETELGAVPYSDLGETAIEWTDPEQARQMQEQTQADWLAVSVGNVHRLVDRKVEIHFPRLRKIEKTCSLPLVIHGASGIRSTDLTALKQTRVGKMNFGTVLRQVFGNALRYELAQRPEEFDRLKLFQEPVAQVEEQAYHMINQLWQEELQ